MSGDCSIYGGFVSGSAPSLDTSWGEIKGNISDQNDLSDELNKRVSKEMGKVLSSNDFTDENKEKLNKLNTRFTATLEPYKWINLRDNIYTQTVQLEDLNSTDLVTIDISLSDDKLTSEKELNYWSKISKIDVNSGSITAYYEGIIPDILFNINIKI